MRATTGKRPSAADIPALVTDRATRLDAGDEPGMHRTGQVGTVEYSGAAWADGGPVVTLTQRRPDATRATTYGTDDTVWVTARRWGSAAMDVDTTVELVLDRAGAERLRDQLTEALER